MVVYKVQWCCTGYNGGVQVTTLLYRCCVQVLCTCAGVYVYNAGVQVIMLVYSLQCWCTGVVYRFWCRGVVYRCTILVYRLQYRCTCVVYRCWCTGVHCWCTGVPGGVYMRTLCKEGAGSRLSNSADLPQKPLRVLAA